MTTEVIKKTQDVLGKYVKKPPLSEKLLGKPPFRYLHDILSVVIIDHGFLKGLFNDDELTSNSIKDKDTKILFLQKIIDATSLAVNEPLDVRPTKIVAGHEVDKTNLLLQAIAKGIEQKIDSSEAVQQVLSGGGGAAAASKSRRSSDAKKVSKSKESKAKATPKDSNGNIKSNESKSKAKISSKNKKDDTIISEPKSKDNPSSKKEKKDGSKPKSKRSSKEDGAKVSSKEEKPKGSSKEEKPKTSSKSREGSRGSKSVKNDGKENDPPEAGAVVEESLARAAPEIENGPVTQALRSKSGRQRAEHINHDPVDGIPAEDTVDEGLVLSDEALSSELVESSTHAIDDNEGPNSLLQINGESSDELNLLETNEPLTNSQPMDVDPAILKALNRDGDLLNLDHLEDGLNPSDSGVGSLESPKNTTKIESLPATAQSKPKSPPPKVPIQAPTPGPGTTRPLSAYHPDLKEKDIIPPNELQDPDSAPQKIPERPRTGMGIRPRTGRKSARPPSARPAPPKVRERKEIPQEEIPRPPTGKPIASVILDNTQQEQEIDNDDDTFMVGNVVETLIDDDMPTTRFDKIDTTMEKNKQELLEGDKDAKGILVAQILETKKELEDGRREAFSPETPGHRRVPIEQGSGASDLTRKKEKELIQKDVEKLTSSIQALTRSVNPLAKMLDYLQEDLDSMQKELETWRDENKVLGQKLKAEQSLTEQQLEPLKAQLDEMESAIFDQQDRISAVKSSILRNDDKVSRLLAGINLNS